MTSNPDLQAKSTLIERLDALYEYDREPVSEKKLHGWKTFIAMFAGEHVAGTEFVLGPLMVMHGVSALDFILGLLTWGDAFHKTHHDNPNQVRLHKWDISGWIIETFFKKAQ